VQGIPFVLCFVKKFLYDFTKSAALVKSSSFESLCSAAIVVGEDDILEVMDILRNISTKRVEVMRHQVEFFWSSYFSSMRVITLTALQIINDRVFPYAAQKYEEWNDLPHRVSQKIILGWFSISWILGMFLGIFRLFITVTDLGVELGKRSPKCTHAELQMLILAQRINI